MADHTMSDVVQHTANVQNNNVLPKNPAALYAPAHDYHSFVPGSRKKSLVPPSTLGDKKSDNLVIEPPKEHTFEIGEFVAPGFFDRVDQSWFSHKASRAEWTYSMRREAQQILPFLYLGPASVARDKDFIRNEGITLLLSIRDKRSAIARLLSGSKVAEELGVQCDSVDVDSDQELIALYPHAIRRINQHISSGASVSPSIPPRVLVFCESGNGRSASVVIAYIMSMLNMDMAAAMWAVHHRRFCIDVDESMQVLLQSFQTILDAKREVVKAHRQEAQRQTSLAVEPPSYHSNGQGLGPGHLTKKRSFIEYNDDDATLAGGHAMESIESGHQNMIDVEHLRQKPAPFVERSL
jgi:serine/threonine/tyrosine-interacting protein